MKHNLNINITQWLKKSQTLLNTTEETFKKFKLDTSNLPKHVYENTEPLSLVFVGQYSAGKSTILKALTGIETIATGEMITTQNTHEYNWNNLTVIDTPGIHTSLRPDHDEISYKAIVNADILIYVVTHELFDSYIGENFRKLLFEKNKANETILIVNKMATVGNTIENRNIKLENLKIVTNPYSPEDLRTCFIDAESYIDSLEEEDNEISTELFERSNYVDLVSTINDFVKERSYTSKLTTSLYKLDTILQSTMLDLSSSSEHTELEQEEHSLINEKVSVLSTQLKIQQNTKKIYTETSYLIKEIGRDLANRFSDFKNEEEANSEIEKAFNSVINLCDKCSENILKLDLNLEQLYKFENTNSTEEIHFTENNSNKNSLTRELLNSDFLSKGSKHISNLTNNNSNISKGLRSYSESTIHEAIKNIGDFFNYKFKPWESLKIVKAIDYTAKTIGIFGTIASFGLQITEDLNAEKRQKEIKENQDKIRYEFNSEAEKLLKFYNDSLEKYINSNFTSKIEDLNKRIKHIRDLKTNKTEKYRKLESLQIECNDLIRELSNEIIDNARIS